MMKGLFLAAFAFLVMIGSAGAVDLSAGATDLTSVGLPGYWAVRADCDASQLTALNLAINPTYEPLVMPVSGVPAPGNASKSPPSNPGRYYVAVIWVGGDAGPPNGDGQPNWPSTCVQSDGATSAAVIGILDGIPIGGF